MSTAEEWVPAIRRAQDRYKALVSPLGEQDVEAPSYASEWSIAQVASHLGSQAEIFGLVLDAGLTGGTAPGFESFPPIWDRWNERTPFEQVADSILTNEEFVTRVEGLTPGELAGFAVSIFGRDIDFTGFGAMRLSEHGLHTWDIEVARDEAALVAPDAIELLVDTLPGVVSYTAKPAEAPATLVVETTAPERRFILTTGPEISLKPDSGTSDPDISLPAEAFVRLVYGRLSPQNTPAGVVGEELLPGLRTVFTGF